jgi:hypothetical protein
MKTSKWLTPLANKIRLAVLVSVFLSSMLSSAQPVANSLLPKVDDRIELLGIVFRLAKPTEVNHELSPLYSKAINSHFKQYAGHALVKYINSFSNSLSRSGNEFGYWDALALAVHLSQPPKLEPQVQLYSVPEDGWDNRTLLTSKMIRLVRQFYHDAKCDEFFKSQRGYFQSVNQEYEKKGAKLNRPWFEQFFGLKTTENYYAVIGLALGNGEYLRVNYQNNHRDTYTIFGGRKFNPNGIPTNFQEPFFKWLIIHEYVHAFSNQLVDKHVDQLKPSAETIIANPKVFGLMKDTFYGNWQYLLYESFVRAGHIKYLMANEGDKSAAENEMAKQEKAGFFWMRGLVDSLGIYEKNRKTYKDLDAFMPELVEYFKKVAKEMKN